MLLFDVSGRGWVFGRPIAVCWLLRAQSHDMLFVTSTHASHGKNGARRQPMHATVIAHCCRLVCKSEALGDLFQHQFGRATTDGLDAGIAGHAFDRCTPHVAGSTVKLQTVIHNFIDEVAA